MPDAYTRCGSHALMRTPEAEWIGVCVCGVEAGHVGWHRCSELHNVAGHEWCLVTWPPVAFTITSDATAPPPIITEVTGDAP